MWFSRVTLVGAIFSPSSMSVIGLSPALASDDFTAFSIEVTPLSSGRWVSFIFQSQVAAGFLGTSASFNASGWAS